MKAKKFKAYVGEPDFHDGTITRVQQGPNDVSVEIKGYSGARYLVRFTGVQSVISHNPEGMVLYALSETELNQPSGNSILRIGVSHMKRVAIPSSKSLLKTFL
jgi:phage gp36-like protein